MHTTMQVIAAARAAAAQHNTRLYARLHSTRNKRNNTRYITFTVNSSAQQQYIAAQSSAQRAAFAQQQATALAAIAATANAMLQSNVLRAAQSVYALRATATLCCAACAHTHSA